MWYLLIVSIIWSLSFGLFKTHLAGLDNNLTACLRMALALPAFLPFLRLRGLRGSHAVGLMSIGAVQFGLMYIALNLSYRYVNGWQVALMTILTPFYITLFDGLLQRRINLRHLLLASLAVAGAAVIRFRGAAFDAALTGFLLVQAANAAFAFGQLAYRELYKRMGPGREHVSHYALLYIGAVIVTSVASTLFGGWSDLPYITLVQWGVLLYMGVLASGLCFFLWNVGASRCSTGMLAVMNNIKIPLAVLLGLTLFNEEADLPRLLAGGGIMVGAVLLAEWDSRRAARAQKPQ